MFSNLLIRCSFHLHHSCPLSLCHRCVPFTPRTWQSKWNGISAVTILIERKLSVPWISLLSAAALQPGTFPSPFASHFPAVQSIQCQSKCLHIQSGKSELANKATYTTLLTGGSYCQMLSNCLWEAEYIVAEVEYHLSPTKCHIHSTAQLNEHEKPTTGDVRSEKFSFWLDIYNFCPDVSAFFTFWFDADSREGGRWIR